MRSGLTLYMLKLFRGNKYIYLHFILFFHIDMMQTIKILPQVNQDLTYSTQSVSWVLMSWWHKEPGHQQQWHWLCWSGLIWSLHTFRVNLVTLEVLKSFEPVSANRLTQSGLAKYENIFEKYCSVMIIKNSDYNHCTRKHQGYVYGKGEYSSTWQK